jgi:dye decolorizing peroxidase
VSRADSSWDRRRVLQLGAAALAGGGASWTGAGALLGQAAPEAATGTTAAGGIGVPPGRQIVAFRAAHQPGVDTPAQAHLSLLGLDLLPGAGTGGLVRLMRLLSDDADRLSAGRAALADTEPELATAPARLSVTFGFGPDVTHRLVRTPEPRLDPLPAFSTDRLEPRWGQTDLVVQVCADDPLTVAHARRMLLKDCASLARTRWIQNGFRRARGTEPDGTTMRNLMGQVDGTANPDPATAEFARLVWSRDGAFAGGTMMVVRRIRAELETWDRVDRAGREAAVGRRLDTGAPLTGENEYDVPDFSKKDSWGFPVIDPASHVARARSVDPAERIFRRGYNYTVPDASRATGEDSGLVFIAFAADLDRQFVPIQRRLAAQDRLNRWVTTIGSAVYAVPPGAPADGYVGQTLLEA